MTDEVLTSLFEQFPAVIRQMDETFTTHEFILALAHRYQKLYIEALYRYRDYQRDGSQAAFWRVHNAIGQRLARLDDLVEYMGQTQSEDIFRQRRKCGEWRKL